MSAIGRFRQRKSSESAENAVFQAALVVCVDGEGRKEYSSRAIRQNLRARGIVAVIPEPQINRATASAKVAEVAGLSATTRSTTSAGT